MNLFSIFTDFESRFDRIDDNKPSIQFEINAEHNARTVGSASIKDRIVVTHDEVMRQALTPRQL